MPTRNRRPGERSQSTRSQTLINQPDFQPAFATSSFTSAFSSQAEEGTGDRDRASGVEKTSVRAKAFGCTVCDQNLSDAQSWRTHEKNQHEKDEIWNCDACEAEFRRARDFMKHHSSHGCSDCSTHTTRCGRQRLKGAPRCSGCVCAKKAHTVLFVPTAYACGFCARLLEPSWSERCKHVIAHFNQGKRVADWDHSKVIRTLIFDRVDLRNAFVDYVLSLTDSQPQIQFSNFFWDKEKTCDLLFDLKCWDSKRGEDPFPLIASAYSLSTRTNPLRQSDPSIQEHTQAVDFNSSRNQDLIAIGSQDGLSMRMCDQQLITASMQFPQQPEGFGITTQDHLRTMDVVSTDTSVMGTFNAFSLGGRQLGASASRSVS